MLRSIFSGIGVYFVFLAQYGHCAGVVVDKPIKAIETKLELAPNLGGNMEWLDDDTLFATIVIDRSKWWDRKVVRVDARSGSYTEEFPHGYVQCANPESKILSVYVGSLEYQYVGGGSKILPVAKTYKKSFWSSKLVETDAGALFNKNICTKTKQEDVAKHSIEITQHGIFYLQGSDEMALLEVGRPSGGAVVSIITGGSKYPVKGLEAYEAPKYFPGPKYLAFRDEYLISGGLFVMGGSLVVHNAEYKIIYLDEMPVIMLGKSGIVRKEFFRGRIKSMEFDEDGAVAPYRDGYFMVVSGRPKHKGGIYKINKDNLERVWCVNDGRQSDRKCNIEEVKLSPDGCKLAFFAKGSDDGLFNVGPSLKILPLCGA